MGITIVKGRPERGLAEEEVGGGGGGGRGVGREKFPPVFT